MVFIRIEGKATGMRAFLFYSYILINFSVSGLGFGLGLEQCACSASRDCSSWLPRSNFESDMIAQIPN